MDALREHIDSTSQELGILRAERSSAPTTDLRRQFNRFTLWTLGG